MKSFLIALSLILPCGLANATLITHNGYTLDTNKKIVSNGALEWLQWDQTTGMSISEALTAFKGQNWVLATNSQIAELFNAFELSYGQFIWTSEENAPQTYDGSTDGIAIEDWENDPELKFVSLFSDTAQAWPFEGTCGAADCLQMSAAYFGSDNDNDGQYKLARVYDDVQFIGEGNFQDWGSLAEMSEDIIDINTDRAYSRGVALVRTVNVPEPQPLAIIILGIMVLNFGRATKFSPL
ncbi:hypothetical protein [Alteromonas sp. P256]|uniref:hypothetical protein n=1 Tax=Alteromonas sp. P256 TaxID=3117399 RepID=UPI002FDFB81E